MASLAIALKDEIRRLARKEIRQQTGSTAQAVTRYRREIAQLKRHAQDLEKRLNFLVSQERKRISAPESSEWNDGNGHDGSRFSARSVRAQRRRTGLSAADYARLIGVSPLTVYNWEQGKTRPRQGQLTALFGLRGIGKREARAKLALLNNGAAEAKSKSRTRRPR